MQKITLLTIGALKESWAKDAARIYRDRIAQSADLRVLELQSSRQPHAEGQRAEESERLLLSARKQSGVLIVLDERGEEITSSEFAQLLGAARDRGEPLQFILGGSYGLTDTVRSAARTVLRLSALTLPHELCRVLFLEQLYRGFEMLKGSGYHH